MKSILCVSFLCLAASLFADQYKYTIHTVTDPESGLPAYHYLLPDGWNASDNITWSKQDRFTPFVFQATLTSPDGETKIEMLPPVANNFAIKGGNVTGVLPPEKAVLALESAFQHFHPNPESPVKDFEKDFDVPFTIGEGAKSVGLCGVLQITFKENGKTYVQYLSATMYEASKKSDNGDVEGTWKIANAFAVTAPQAEFQKAYTLFASVVSAEGMSTKFMHLMLMAMSTPPGTDLDVKALTAQAGEPGANELPVFAQSADRHRQATEKIFPLFHNAAMYKTEAGPMLFFGSFSVFADSAGHIVVDDKAGSAAPSGFKKLAASKG